MSSIQTFSRLALKQFCVLLEEAGGHSSGGDGDLETAIWTKMTAGNPAAESIRIPYPLLKKTLRKLKIELPYMPTIINYNIGCSALKVTGGLYVPCCGNCEEDSAYCGVCSKQEVKYGVLEDRGDVGTYSDPFDKHEISYGTWLAKTEKTLEEVYEALESEGFKLVIPSHYLTVNSKRIVKDVKARKGRPKAAKKEVTGDDSDSGSASESEEKKVKKPKSKKTKGSDDESGEEKPVKVKKPKAKKSKGSDDDSDAEKPVKVKKPKAKKPKGSDADSDGEVEKPKAEKPKKVKSPKGSDADSDAEKPKKPKDEKTKSPKGPELDVADKWSNLVYGEEKEDEKSKKEKKAKSGEKSEKKVKSGEKSEKKAKSDEKSEKKAKSDEKSEKPKKVKSPKGSENSNSTDMSARFGAELTADEYVPSGFDARRETLSSLLSEPVWIDEVAYNLRGKHLFDTETGEKVGEIGDDGVAVLDQDDDF